MVSILLSKSAKKHISEKGQTIPSSLHHRLAVLRYKVAVGSWVYWKNVVCDYQASYILWTVSDLNTTRYTRPGLILSSLSAPERVTDYRAVLKKGVTDLTLDILTMFTLTVWQLFLWSPYIHCIYTDQCLYDSH